MKNKGIIAIILVFAMLQSLFVPVIGQSTVLHTNEAMILQQIGLMAGGLKDQNLGGEMSRLQGLIFAIRASGKAGVAEAMTDLEVNTQLSKFIDSGNIPTYGKKYVAYAVVNKITLGIGNNKFGALEPISGTSFLVFLLKTGMGYTSVNTSNVLDMAAEASVITIAQKETYKSKPVLVRDDAAVILYNAVLGGKNDDGKKFIDSLIESGFVSRETYQTAIVSTNESIPAPAEDGLTVEEIAKNSNHIVMLKCFDISGNPKSFGSGFIISTDGQIVTNYHVIDFASSITATLQDGQTFKIESVLAYDVEKDLAVLKATGLSLKSTLTLGSSSNVSVGQNIVAIGNPEGLSNTVSTGIISSIRPNQARNSKDFQISAPISHGSSGGPLFNMKGEVIGINYAGLDEGQNLNFSIPVDDLKPMLRALKAKTFSQVKNEIHPKPSIEDLGDLMFEKYNIIEVDGYTLKLDHYMTKLATAEENTIYHYVGITDIKSVITYYLIIADDSTYLRLNEITTQMMKDVTEWYPGYNQYGEIAIYSSLTTEPTAAFDEITYNEETKLWDVWDSRISFDKYDDKYGFYVDND